MNVWVVIGSATRLGRINAARNVDCMQIGGQGFADFRDQQTVFEARAALDGRAVNDHGPMSMPLRPYGTPTERPAPGRRTLDAVAAGEGGVESGDGVGHAVTAGQRLPYGCAVPPASCG